MEVDPKQSTWVGNRNNLPNNNTVTPPKITDTGGSYHWKGEAGFLLLSSSPFKLLEMPTY